MLNTGINNELVFITFGFLFFLVSCTTIESRTYFGRPVHVSEAPYIAGILIKNTVCTGSLITRRLILTAARCLLSEDKQIKIFLGTRTIDAKSSNFLEVEDVFKHPAYKDNLLQSEIGDPDVALIKMVNKVDLEGEIKSLAISDKPWPSESIRYPKPCFVLGFGKNRKSGEYGSLHGSRLPVEHGSDACGCAFITSEQKGKVICLVKNAKDRTCYGDTGGPLICDDAIVGIAHGSARCPGFVLDPNDLLSCGKNTLVDTFLYLYPYIDWIQEHIKSEDEDKKNIGLGINANINLTNADSIIGAADAAKRKIVQSLPNSLPSRANKAILSEMLMNAILTVIIFIKLIALHHVNT